MPRSPGGRRTSTDASGFTVLDDAYPYAEVSGIKLEKLSHQAALAKLKETMGYDALRAEQARLREQGVYRGIGLAAVSEIRPGRRRSAAASRAASPVRSS